MFRDQILILIDFVPYHLSSFPLASLVPLGFTKEIIEHICWIKIRQHLSKAPADIITAS
jgi:hypothetical protein